MSQRHFHLKKIPRERELCMRCSVKYWVVRIHNLEVFLNSYLVHGAYICMVYRSWLLRGALTVSSGRRCTRTHMPSPGRTTRMSALKEKRSCCSGTSRTSGARSWVRSLWVSSQIILYVSLNMPETACSSGFDSLASLSSRLWLWLLFALVDVCFKCTMFEGASRFGQTFSFLRCVTLFYILRITLVFFPDAGRIW